MRLRLVSCQVFAHEIARVHRQTPCGLTITCLPKGLHELPPAEMGARLQAVVDGFPAKDHDAVILAYGLCGLGLAGLTARARPLVVPRCHDCLAILFGNRRRFAEFFAAHPDSYFQSVGWRRNRRNDNAITENSRRRQLGMLATETEYVRRYGPEAGGLLWRELGETHRHYRQLVYITSGAGEHPRHEAEARREAHRCGWRFLRVPGALTLLQQLVSGHWHPDDFLLVPPGHRIAATGDEAVMQAVRVPPNPSPS